MSAASEYRETIDTAVRFLESMSVLMGESRVEGLAQLIEWLVPRMRGDGHAEKLIEEMVGDICDAV